MTDQKTLVDRILTGDRAAFRILVQEYQRLVSHIVFRLVPHSHDREDICQEVFLKVYQHLNRFRFDSQLSTWIGRIAYNTSLNFVEKKKALLLDDLAENDDREAEIADDESSAPDIELTRREVSGILQYEIDRLPTVYKAIVTLYHLDDMSYGEIAQTLKLPEGTVKSYLFRARKLLKDRLSKKYQREDL